MKQLIFLSIIAIIATSCSDGNASTLQVRAGNPTKVDESPAECPFLTKDGKGNTVLSWVRTLSDSTTAFCYATSTDGTTFSKPVVVPNSSNIQPHGENLPKILFKPSGEIIALWGTKSSSSQNKYAGMVSYTQSFDGGKTWTPVQPLVHDTAGHDQRYYDVAVLPNGEGGIIWLDNRKTTDKEGSGLYFASTNGKDGFGAGKLISEPCCQCCRTDLYVDGRGGIHALFRGIVQDSIRDMVHIVSNNGGTSFSAPKRISEDNWVLSGCPHTGPAITENNTGLHFAWFTGGKDKGCYYTQTKNNGNTFSVRDGISGVGSHPQLTALPDGNMLIVWDEHQMAGKESARTIGLQQRDAEGKAGEKQYLTTSGNSSYPVIAAVQKNIAMVAYTSKKGEQNFVTYQTIRLQ